MHYEHLSTQSLRALHLTRERKEILLYFCIRTVICSSSDVTMVLQ